MLRLPKFQYVAPCSVEEACSLLQEYEGEIKVIAGGTDLLPSMKQRLFTPKYILDLKRIPGLNQIGERADGEITIGSLTTLTTLENSPVIKSYFLGLAQAVDSVAATQVKNMGTIGGNIALDTRCLYFNQSHLWRKSFEPCLKRGGNVCHVVKGGEKCYAYFAADTVPVLIALGAKVTINNNKGERQCDLPSLYTQDGKAPNTLKPGEVITEIAIPVPKEKSGNTYKKLRLRGAIDFSLIGVAVNLTMEDGVCKTIKVVLGAVGSGPIVVESAEKLLQGTSVTEALIEEAGTLARKAAKPVANTGTSPGYRRDMAALLTKMCLREALTKAKVS